MNRRGFLASSLAAFVQPTPDPRAFVDRAVRALSERSGDGFWLQIVDAEEVLLRRRRGYERQDPVPLGSTRKWLTAALVMVVAEQGRVELDAPIGRWLPSWNTPDRTDVTLRRLMSHTAGIKRRPQNGFCHGLGSLEACVDKMAQAPLAVRPGTEFRYSSAGFHIVARVLEAAMGDSFTDLLSSLLLEPLQMSETTLRPAGPELEEMTGEIWSSPVDFTHFLQMLLADGTFRGRRVLSARSVRELETGQVDGVRFTGSVPAHPWWPEGHAWYALGVWRNAQDAGGRTTVVTAEGKAPRGGGWFVAWLDRRAQRAGCAAMAAPERSREAFRDLVEATCTWAGVESCEATWGVGED